MAEWKKVVVSGSEAALDKLTLGKIAEASVLPSPYAVVITGSNGELFFTSSNAISGGGTTTHALTEGAGIADFSFDGGSSGVTVAVSGAASLSSNTLTRWDGDAFVDSPLSSNGTSITSSGVISSSAAITASGFNGDGSGITGITGSKTNEALTLGEGLGTSIAGDDTFDGDTALTVSVSGAADLTDNIVVKWNNSDGKFAVSSITDDPTTGVTTTADLTVEGNATFGNDSSDKVTVTGDLIVNGTASFVNQQSLQIADKFISLNSGSTGTAGGGIVIGNSGTQNGLGSLLGVSDNLGTGRFGVKADFDAEQTTFPGSLDAFMGLTSASTAANPNDVTNTTIDQNGNIYVDTANNEIWIYG